VEHYLPVLYAFAQRRSATTILTRGIEAASLSMLSLRFD
jgi:aromatic ring-opening dioxygenase catalytic subunit (LigB family)